MSCCYKIRLRIPYNKERALAFPEAGLVGSGRLAYGIGDGVAQIDASPDRLMSWILELRDADGQLLVGVEQEACPNDPQNFEFPGG